MGGGGSAASNSTAITRSRCSGHRNGGKRLGVHAQCTCMAKQGSGGVVLRCRGATTAERRGRNAGMRAPATRVSYGLPDLVQQKEGGNAVLTEARN